MSPAAPSRHSGLQDATLPGRRLGPSEYHGQCWAPSCLQESLPHHSPPFLPILSTSLLPLLTHSALLSPPHSPVTYSTSHTASVPTSPLSHTPLPVLAPNSVTSLPLRAPPPALSPPPRYCAVSPVLRDGAAAGVRALLGCCLGPACARAQQCCRPSSPHLQSSCAPCAGPSGQTASSPEPLAEREVHGAEGPSGPRRSLYVAGCPFLLLNALPWVGETSAPASPASWREACAVSEPGPWRPQAGLRTLPLQK